MVQEHSDLRRTRASLFYLITYLFPLAAGLLISPTDTFHLLGSRVEGRRRKTILASSLLPPDCVSSVAHGRITPEP